MFVHSPLSQNWELTGLPFDHVVPQSEPSMALKDKSKEKWIYTSKLAPTPSRLHFRCWISQQPTISCLGDLGFIQLELFLLACIRVSNMSSKTTWSPCMLRKTSWFCNPLASLLLTSRTTWRQMPFIPFKSYQQLTLQKGQLSPLRKESLKPTAVYGSVLRNAVYGGRLF